MKKVGNFQTEDPLRLSEQLDRFQDATDQETTDIRAGFIPQLSQQVFIASTAIGSTLIAGQIALCDSSLGNVSVTLSASVTKPGWLAVVKRVAANTVTVKPSGLMGAFPRKINAATSIAITAVGLTWIYFDGSDWWA